MLMISCLGYGAYVCTWDMGHMYVRGKGKERKEKFLKWTGVGGSYEKDAHAGRELHRAFKVQVRHQSGLRTFFGVHVVSVLKRWRSYRAPYKVFVR
jgi:hypothetical protein